MKRKMFLLMAMVLAVTSILAACGKGSGSGETQAPKATAGAAGSETTAASGENTDPMGKYDETITMSFFAQKDDSVKFSDGDTWEDNLWTRHYLDKLNIQVQDKWIVDATQYDQQVAMSITSRDLADVMAFKVGDKNLQTLYENDQLADLSQVFDQYASDLLKEIMNYDGGVGLSSCYDGEVMYALPRTNPSTDSAPLLWVRSDWLEKSGKEFPKTVDELVELAKLFSESDYDGADAYGVAIYNELYQNGQIGSIAGFFNGMESYPINWVKGDDGKLVYGGVTPSTRSALEVLSGLYKDGALDREFVVKDANAICEDLTSGKVGITFGPQWLPVWPLNQGVGAIDGYDWVSGPLPTADGSYCKPLVPIGVQGYYAVRKDYEHPEAVIKMLNLFVEDAFGDGDISYFVTTDKYQEPFKLAKLALSQPDKNIQIWKACTAALKGDTSLIGENKEAEQNYLSIKQWQENPVAENNQGWGYERIFGENGSISVLNDYEQKNALIINEFYGGSTPTMSSKMATLNTMQLETYTKIITGEADITAYDDFVEKWYSLGGQDITDEVNEWYGQTH